MKDFSDSEGIEVEILRNNGYYSVYEELGEGQLILMFMVHLDGVLVNGELIFLPPQ